MDQGGPNRKNTSFGAKYDNPSKIAFQFRQRCANIFWYEKKRLSMMRSHLNLFIVIYSCDLRFPRALGAAEEEFEGGFGFDALAVF